MVHVQEEGKKKEIKQWKILVHIEFFLYLQSTQSSSERMDTTKI
jgi:hypothetical protein